MKNQYFGDVNDYKKYGLLRGLSCDGAIKTFVCWMLTESDNRIDGNKRIFLSKGEDIFVAKEGDIVDRRYKVVHIGTNSVEVQDVLTNYPPQTLPLSLS